MWSFGGLFVDTLRSHGVAAQVSAITPSFLAGPPPPGYQIVAGSGFYVNTTHPGQGNNGPPVSRPPDAGLPDHFSDHAVVKIPSLFPNNVFDPSYGLLFDKPTMAESEQDWEDRSITFYRTIYTDGKGHYKEIRAINPAGKQTSWNP